MTKAHGKFATRDTENADKNVGNEIMLGHRDTKNADRLLGHRDIKNADNLGHRDTEILDRQTLFYSRLLFEAFFSVWNTQNKD